MTEFNHHGIEGQKWGVRNGPPYPLDRMVSTGKALKSTLEARKKHKLDEKYKKRALKFLRGDFWKTPFPFAMGFGHYIFRGSLFLSTPKKCLKLIAKLY